MPEEHSMLPKSISSKTAVVTIYNCLHLSCQTFMARVTEEVKLFNVMVSSGVTIEKIYVNKLA